MKFRRPAIFCDMDGVLVDWDGGVERLLGMRIDEAHAMYPDKADRYERIVAADPDFYQNLDWLPEGKRLWIYLRHHAPSLLTAYSRHVPGGDRLKRNWAMRELGLPPERVYAYMNKWEKKQHAVDTDGSPNVLIDDEPRNIDEWAAAGGIGILHTSVDETIRRLRELGFGERTGSTSPCDDECPIAPSECDG